MELKGDNPFRIRAFRTAARTLAGIPGDLGEALEDGSLAGKPEPSPIDGFTPAQRFFIAYAVSWREKVRPETERTLVVSNPHSSIRWRVNGVVGHLPAFAEAFGCKSGDPLARPPEQQMQIW